MGTAAWRGTASDGMGDGTGDSKRWDRIGGQQIIGDRALGRQQVTGDRALGRRSYAVAYVCPPRIQALEAWSPVW